MSEGIQQPVIPQRRASDMNGFARMFCWLARRASDFWDWIDKRDLDKHAVSIVILSGTWKLTTWAMAYAAASQRPGFEIAAIIAAVIAPYMALQAAAIAFYFTARSTIEVSK